MDLECYNSVICSRKKREKTTETWKGPQMSINNPLDKYCDIFYSGIPHKSAWTTATSVNVDDWSGKQAAEEHFHSLLFLCRPAHAVKYMELSAWFLPAVPRVLLFVRYFIIKFQVKKGQVLV